MAPARRCGSHQELASNEAVRVTRCGCGTVHVTLLGSGVTVRMSIEALRGVAGGLGLAADRIVPPPAEGTTVVN